MGLTVGRKTVKKRKNYPLVVKAITSLRPYFGSILKTKTKSMTKNVQRSKLPYGTKEGFLYDLIKPLSNAATCIMIVFLSSKKDHTSSKFSP